MYHLIGPVVAELDYEKGMVSNTDKEQLKLAPKLVLFNFVPAFGYPIAER